MGEIAPQKGRFFSPNQEILGRFFHTKEGDWGDYPLQTGDLGEIQLKQLSKKKVDVLVCYWNPMGLLLALCRENVEPTLTSKGLMCSLM